MGLPRFRKFCQYSQNTNLKFLNRFSISNAYSRLSCHFSFLIFKFPTMAFSWLMAIWLSFSNRSACVNCIFINSEFMLSMFANTNSCSILAWSLILPSAVGLSSRYCLAVLANSATLNTSASLAYTKLACSFVIAFGIICSFIASVWIR